MWFKKSSAYGNRLNSYDICKLVALAAMIADHLGNYFWTDFEGLRIAGRVAFPLFLFLVGYSGRWKIKPDLIIPAVMLTLCAALTHHPVFPLNILFSIALTRAAMPFVTHYEMTPRYLRGIFIAAIAWFPLFIWIDYSTLSLLFALCGHLQRQKPGSSLARIFLYATVILYLAVEWYCFKFSVRGVLFLLLLLLPVTWGMAHFMVRELSLIVSDKTCFLLRWAARNTLAIYALHIMVFMVLERIYFPARLTHFQWL